LAHDVRFAFAVMGGLLCLIGPGADRVRIDSVLQADGGTPSNKIKNTVKWGSACEKQRFAADMPLQRR